MNRIESENHRSARFTAELDSALGLFCLWDVSSYRKIHTLEDWEAVFSSRMAFEKEISLQRLVPIYFYGYGSYRFCVRPFDEFTAKEQENHPLISQPYRLHTEGMVGLCGAEYIGDSGQPFHRLLLRVAPGDYSVTTVLSATKEKAKDSGFDRLKKDFCDVALLIKKADKNVSYRTAAATFYP